MSVTELVPESRAAGTTAAGSCAEPTSVQTTPTDAGLPTASVAVRALCEFTARAGDLDRRFVPAPTAQQGIAGHGVVFQRRPAHYEREVSLDILINGLRVRGRADGFDPVGNRVEEIKTHRGELSRMPGNQRALHWAQAKVYAHLLCVSRHLERIDVALVYFHIGSQQETVLVETHEASSLSVFFNDQCARYSEWARQEATHRVNRDESLHQLVFPHGTFRAGQRVLAEGVYRGLRDGRAVLAQAPTGIGKSIGTLFPALKACATQGIDKLFFLTAKTPGRMLALDALARLKRTSAAPFKVRTLELISREKACEFPGRACNGEDCTLARGFYDRLPQARLAATQSEATWDAAAVRSLALAHDICPYYLSQELVRWSDIVVADYNYYFDMSAMLYAYTLAQQWRVGVLVDEAHNLVARARSMYSAQLDQRELDQARRLAPPHLRKPLVALHRQWQAWNKTVLASSKEAAEHVKTTIDSIEQPPEGLIAALSKATTTVIDLLEDGNGVDPRVMQFFFDALNFVKLAESFGSHSLFDVAGVSAKPATQSLTTQFRSTQSRPTQSRTALAIRNVVPAGFLAPRYASTRSTALFSGTLNPMQYYVDMLGLPRSTQEIDVPSPFSSHQLEVNIVDSISTRYRDRDRSVDQIAALIAAQFARRPGNYLSFFSSFDYMNTVSNALAQRYPDIPIWTQTASMSESARQAFVSRFQEDGKGIGFAVLGGAFGEAIDLPGNRLIGAFIATLGLPQHNAINTRIVARLEAQFGRGYDYTYLYPGLQNVVQAAGRVIRTESDAGVVYLIDDRYASRQVKTLLPNWWQPAKTQLPLR